MKYRTLGTAAATIAFLAGVAWTLYEPKGLGPPVAFGGLVGGLVVLGTRGR